MAVHYATEQGGHSSHRRDVCTASPVGPEGFPQEIALSSPDGIHCRQEAGLVVAAKEWISSAGSIIRLTGIATGGQLTRCCARTKDSPAQRKKTNCIEWSGTDEQASVRALKPKSNKRGGSWSETGERQPTVAVAGIGNVGGLTADCTTQPEKFTCLPAQESNSSPKRFQPYGHTVSALLSAGVFFFLSTAFPPFCGGEGLREGFSLPFVISFTYAQPSTCTEQYIA